MSSQDMLDLDDQQAGPGQLAQGGCHIPTVARAKTSSGITFRSDSRVMMSEMHDSSRHVRRCRAELNVPSPVKAVAVTMSHYEALVLDSRRLFVVWPVDAASDAPAAACSSGAAFVIVRTYCLALLVSLSQKRRLPGALRQVSPWPGRLRALFGCLRGASTSGQTPTPARYRGAQIFLRRAVARSCLRPHSRRPTRHATRPRVPEPTRQSGSNRTERLQHNLRALRRASRLLLRWRKEKQDVS